jgi:hypothetical protein
MKLQNKVVLVTGAALGYKNGGPSIGRESIILIDKRRFLNNILYF